MSAVITGKEYQYLHLDCINQTHEMVFELCDIHTKVWKNERVPIPRLTREKLAVQTIHVYPHHSSNLRTSQPVVISSNGSKLQRGA